MPTYEVTIYGTWTKTYHVTAETEDAAKDLWDDFDGEPSANVQLVHEQDLGEDDQEWEGATDPIDERHVMKASE